MMRKNTLICSLWTAILIACIMSTGCTSTQSTQASGAGNSPVATPPSQTLTAATAPATIATTLAPAPAPAAIASTTATPPGSGLTVTLNSAEKKAVIGGGTPKPGVVMLVLDITLQNNDPHKAFEISDNAFLISFRSAPGSHPAMTTQVSKSLVNPLFSGSIAPGSNGGGRIVFAVNASSSSYKLSVVDPAGTVLGSVDTINVP